MMMWATAATIIVAFASALRLPEVVPCIDEQHEESEPGSEQSQSLQHHRDARPMSFIREKLTEDEDTYATPMVTLAMNRFLTITRTRGG